MKPKWSVILIIGESYINKKFTTDYELLKSVDEKIKGFIEVFEKEKDSISLFTVMGINFLEGQNKVYYRIGEVSILKNYTTGDITFNHSENVFYSEESFKRFISKISIETTQRILIVNYGHGSIFGQFAVALTGFSNISKMVVLKDRNEYEQFIKAEKIINDKNGKIETQKVKEATDVKDYLIADSLISILLYSEYANVLEATIAKDRKVDIMLNYICLTQNCAAIYEFIDTVKYMVGPTTGIDMPSYNYTALLTEIKDTNKSVKEIAINIINKFNVNRTQNDTNLIDKAYWSLSTLDLSNFRSVSEKLRIFVESLLQENNFTQICGDALNDEFNLPLDKVCLSLKTVFCVRKFIEKIILSVTNMTDSAKQNAKELIKEIDAATIAQFHSKGFLQALNNNQQLQSGLGIFIPRDKNYYDDFRQTIMDENELEQTFHSDKVSLWKKLLNKYLSINT